MKFLLFLTLVNYLKISSQTMMATLLLNEKNCILLFSMYALKDVLPECHLHYWQPFVLACHLLCRSCINQTDLMHILKEYEKINGEHPICISTIITAVFMGFGYSAFKDILVLYKSNANKIHQIRSLFSWRSTRNNCKICQKFETAMLIVFNNELLQPI